MEHRHLPMIAIVSCLLVTGCDRKNNPLLSGPSAGVTSVSLFIPQIDTHNNSENRIFVYVADQTDTAVTGFQIGNFSILEDGNPGVPFDVGRVYEPLYLALVIDRSGSMSGSGEAAAETAATTLINALGSSDYAALVEFSNTVQTTVNFTNDKSTLNFYISSGTSSGGTAVYDAINVGAGLLQNQPGRRLLLVLTDGEDNSSNISLGGVIDSVNRKGLSAYTVGLGSFINTSALQQIADSTGGVYATSVDGSDLGTIFTNVLSRFNNLTYIKYRRRSQGRITVYLNYGSFSSNTSKALD